MIDDIVEMILKEAMLRPGQSLVFQIYRVCIQIDIKIIEILSNLLDEERSKTQDGKRD